MKDLNAITKAKRRRYYLKQKLKDVFQVDTRKKQVNIPVLIPEISDQQKIWLLELGNQFGYNLQTTISGYGI